MSTNSQAAPGKTEKRVMRSLFLVGMARMVSGGLALAVVIWPALQYMFYVTQYISYVGFEDTVFSAWMLIFLALGALHIAYGLGNLLYVRQLQNQTARFRRSKLPNFLNIGASSLLLLVFWVLYLLYQYRPQGLFMLVYILWSVCLVLYILLSVLDMATIQNKAVALAQPEAVEQSGSQLELLAELDDLRDRGVLSEAEYEAKRLELLKKSGN